MTESVFLPIEKLTAREQEVLRLLAQEGLRNKDLANRLFISEKTVWRHLSNIYAKLGVKSRTEAILFVYRYGFLLQNT